MDIHAPHNSVSSIKEGLIHILIVTIGILIALGLEGAREMFREHKLVNEARAAFKAEFIGNKNKIDKEVENTQKVKAVLDRLLADFPEIEKHPEAFSARLGEIRPALYTLSNSAWEVALSTGALAHIEPDEAAVYGSAAQSARLYTDEEMRLLDAYIPVKSYIGARLDANSLAVLERQLRVMDDYEAILVHGALQTQQEIERALKKVQ